MIFFEKLKMTEEDLLAKFKKEIYDHISKIDPENELERFSMAVGFFLAMGIKTERAYELSTPACIGKIQVPKCYFQDSGTKKTAKTTRSLPPPLTGSGRQP